MKGLILAAGYGTRLINETESTNNYEIPENLRETILEYPKPLLPVNGMTIIDHIIKRTEKYVSDFYLVSNDLHFQKYLDWKTRSGRNIEILNDGTVSNETRLGAIKDIHFSLKYMEREQDLMIVGGDNLIGHDYFGLVDTFRKKHSSVIGIYDVKDLEKAKRHGVISINKNGKVIEFEEKPINPKSTLCSTCTYIIKKDDLAFLDEFLSIGQNLDVPGHFVKFLSEKSNVFTWKIGEDLFYDIGNLKCYLNAKRFFEE